MTIQRQKKDELLKHLHMAARADEQGDIFGTLGAMMAASSVRSEIFASPGVKFEDVDPIVSQVEYVRGLVSNMLLHKVGAKKDIDLVDFDIEPETYRFRFEIEGED
jgi:hypothetical protein